MTYKIEEIIKALSISNDIMLRQNRDNTFIKDAIEYLNRYLEITKYLTEEMKKDNNDYKRIVETIFERMNWGV